MARMGVALSEVVAISENRLFMATSLIGHWEVTKTADKTVQLSIYRMSIRCPDEPLRKTKRKYYEQYLTLFAQSNFLLTECISPLAISTSAKCKLSLCSGSPQLRSLSALEAHSQCNMTGIASCCGDGLKGRAHTERDLGNKMDIQVYETDTHPVFARFFQTFQSHLIVGGVIVFGQTRVND
jgi:hypothetical protein